MDIEEIKRNFDNVKKYTLCAELALEAVKQSNACVPIFDKTKEGNVFNICRESLYLRCIVEVRRILEPFNRDKRSNLSFLIQSIFNNKEYFIEEHYRFAMQQEHNGNEEIEFLFCDIVEEEKQHCSNQIDIIQEKWNKIREMQSEVGSLYDIAEEEKQHCSNQIDIIQAKWNKIWKMQSEGRSLYFVREKRNIMIHSIDVTNVYAPPMYKMQKIISIINWFIKKLEYIINNTATSKYLLHRQIKDISKNFWSHMS